MSSIRLAFRSVRPSMVSARPISTTSRRMAGPGNAKEHSTAEEHRGIQSEKALNPHMTNTNSTIVNDMPSVGAQKAPPELISSIAPDFSPKDSVPENTERMTGGTQKGAPESGLDSELDVGEMEGAKFKVEPLRRTGEDPNTTRARLLCMRYAADQSRKRGTLESDLLMSTFAEAHLREMSPAQMAQYDLFLDENDWDIYYWATQEPSPTSMETAEGSGPTTASPVAQGTDLGKQTGPESKNDEGKHVKPSSGEWAQTVGTFKPAYRPVPARWRNSEILAMLKRHVVSRSAGGIHEGQAEVSGEGLSQSVKGTGGGGMAFMPPVFQTDRR
ncbi:Succinate dehydrogenase assembly factor [Hyphodiscus hymeniophilus]|uniref:Succinate dehydrogenase assembly factor 2, mitochondrial n=1 Tax=Hyphodiscus hymeniophilus TaxID=353542 RepID=A0A9P6VSS1_9HELO|nr:Succinate dehydrogenase assembly factor [Hyphodiscus hymeniophilus]